MVVPLVYFCSVNVQIDVYLENINIMIKRLKRTFEYAKKTSFKKYTYLKQEVHNEIILNNQFETYVVLILPQFIYGCLLPPP